MPNRTEERTHFRELLASSGVQILVTLIATLGTVAVGYFQYVKPKTAEQAQQVAKDQTNATLNQKAASVEQLTSQLQKVQGQVENLTARLEAMQVGRDAEVPVTVDNTTQNTTQRYLFIAGYCGADTREREIEARIGETVSNLTLASTALGTARINLAVVVPPNWYYRVGETNHLPCTFRGWKI